MTITHLYHRLEDLKVLRRSPHLLNNVKIGQGQLQLLMEQILFLPYTFWSSDLNNLMNNPSNSPVISEKKMSIICANLVGPTLGLARLIEISVNRSIYKRKTIIDMQIQKSVTFNVCSVYLFN